MKKTFKLNAKNDTGKVVNFALLKGTFPSLAELQDSYPFIDALATDGVILTDDTDTSKKCTITCPERGKSIKHFQEYFGKMVGRVTFLEITSSSRENLNGEVKFAPTMPFDAPSPDVLRLSPYLSINQQDTTRLQADLKDDKEEIPLTPLSFTAFSIEPNSEMAIILTIEFGAGTNS